jgi:predicted DNA-binding transcriptional regulator AlpA
METYEMDLDPFNRKQEAIEFSGLGSTEFHLQIADGRFPPPDALLGPRMPVWLTSTLRKWQEKKLAEPKPVHTGFGAAKAGA